MSMGATEEYIANKLKLDPKELRAHYAAQLDMGLEEANLRVAQTFFDMATSGEHPQMTIAWMKMRGGPTWTENSNSTPGDDQADQDAVKHKLLKLLNRGLVQSA